MSAPAFRYKSLEPDFRRDPKTACYCALCQKDIKGEPKFFAHMIDGCAAAVHPEDRDIANREVPEQDNFGLLAVGPDCAKIIGREFVYTAEQAAAVKNSGLEAEAPPAPSFKI
jgi:hypothetical protein